MRLDRASGVGEEAQRRCGGCLPRPASRGRAPLFLPPNSDGHPSWGPASQTTVPASFVPTPQFSLAPVPKPVPSVNPMPSHPLATGTGGCRVAAPSSAPSREPAKPVSHPGAWSCTVSAACGLFACSVKTRHMTDGARLEWLGGLQGRVWYRSMKKAAVRACSGEPLVTGGPKDLHQHELQRLGPQIGHPLVLTHAACLCSSACGLATCGITQPARHAHELPNLHRWAQGSQNPHPAQAWQSEVAGP